MTDERQRILTMLADGKLTVAQAEQLLNAVQSSSTHSPPQASTHDPTPAAKAKAKFLHVHVDSDKGERVNIKLPVQLLRSGLKFSRLVPPHARTQIDAALRDKGVGLNMDNLTDNLDELLDSLSELSIDVEDQDEKIRIFLE